MRRLLATATLSACAVFAQTPAFEVASIKPAAPQTGGRIMIGASSDPGRVSYTFTSFKDLLARAYRMKSYQISGPSWMDSERYDINAKIPEGMSDKVPEMLQTLLIERFQMVSHKETKELPIYALIVGKGGPKLKVSDDNAPPPQFTTPTGAKIDAPKGGGPAGGGMMMMATNGGGSGKMQLNRATMDGFANMLSRMLDRPVLDMTEIKGNYDIVLEVSMEDMIGIKKMAAGLPAKHMEGDGGPAPEGAPAASIFSAVQQLGLKLDSRKAPVDMLVVDKAEKVATEN